MAAVLQLVQNLRLKNLRVENDFLLPAGNKSVCLCLITCAVISYGS